MRSGRWILVMLLVGVAAGCSSPSQEARRIIDSPIDARSELDPGVDMKDYTLWRWLPNPNLDAVDAELKDPEIRQMIGNAIQGEMFSRGYRYSEESPDMIMNFHIAIKKIDEKYIDDVYNGEYLPDYRTDFSGPKKAAKEWDEGTLLFMLFDAKTGKMIWRGSVQAEVTPESLDIVPMKERQKRIEKAVRMMFQDFPRK